jgi:phosphate:Na+ symporter
LSLEDLLILLFTITGSSVLLVYGSKVLIDTPYYLFPFLGKLSEQWLGHTTLRSLVSGIAVSLGTMSSSATIYSGLSNANTGVIKPEQIPIFMAASLGITAVPLWFCMFHWGWYELIFLTFGFFISAKFKPLWSYGLGRLLLALGIMALGSRLLVVGLGSQPEMALFSNHLLFAESSSEFSTLILFSLSLIFIVVTRSIVSTVLVTAALLESEFFDFTSSFEMLIFSFLFLSFLPMFHWKKLSTNLKNSVLQELIIKIIYCLILFVFVNQISTWLQEISLSLFQDATEYEEFLDESEPIIGTFHLYGFPLAYVLLSFGYMVWTPGLVYIFKKLKIILKEPSAIKEFQKLYFIGEIYNVSPQQSLKQLRVEIQKMAALVQSILQLSQEIFTSWKVEGQNLEKILKYEAVTDRIQIEINDYISNVMRLSLTIQQGRLLRSFLRMTKELESLADGCKALLYLQKNLIELEKLPSSETMLEMKNYFIDYLKLFELLFSDMADENETLFLNKEIHQIFQARIIELKAKQLEILNRVYNINQPELSTHWLSEVMFQCDQLLKHTQNLYECRKS